VAAPRRWIECSVRKSVADLDRTDRGPTIEGPAIRHRFTSEDGSELQVDADLWLCALDLAVFSGWKPDGIDEPADDAWKQTAGEWDRLEYGVPRGQRIGATDASGLASSLTQGLELVPDAEVPMRGKAFGEENTRGLIGKAHDGRAIQRPKLPAAAEILSGSHKADARALAEFMARGAFTLHATQPA
jgi:hypothetical protein